MVVTYNDVEPSVEGTFFFCRKGPLTPLSNKSCVGGQVFQQQQQHHPPLPNEPSVYGGGELFHPEEALPESHSVSRGTRLLRNALVVVTESEQGIEAATCQYPGKKDQDRYTVQLSASVEKFPHYCGLFDGHGTSVFAADLCATSLLSTVLEGCDLTLPSTQLPADEALIKAFRTVHDRVVDNVKRHPRSGTTAIACFVGLDSTTPVDSFTVKTAWVGDSRAIMVAADGAVTPLTRDHSLSSNPDEVKRIQESNHEPRAGLLESPSWQVEEQMASERGLRARASSFVGRRELNGRESGPLVVFAHSGGVSLQVSRSIGDVLAARSVICDPEITRHHVKKNAFTRIIAASDGLWDVYTSEAAAKMVADIAVRPLC